MGRNLPYDGPLAIADHGVIGDRRTAALIGADGAIVWYCLPDYAGRPVFGALLDPTRGGFWQMSPVPVTPGAQRYERDSMTLVTSWDLPDGVLDLTDTMAWPWDNRHGEQGGPQGHVILRRLRCTRGTVPVQIVYQPRNAFEAPAPLQAGPSEIATVVEAKPLRLWANRELQVHAQHVSLQADLSAGQEIWSVLAWGEEDQQPWNTTRASTELAAATTYWQNWVDSLPHPATDLHQHRCHALILKLLTYAPTGSPVAAPTSSLPERLGGDRNWDYRFSWVRDAALCVSVLSQLGDLETGRRFMDCLATYRTSTESPLQVVYGVNGELDLPETQRWDLAGYRNSRPVRFGNRACGQRQLDSLGFFVDSALTYLECGGEWTTDHWTMVHRAAAYTMDHWQLPDSGIWELLDERHYVSSKVMSWVALDRSVRIAQRVGRTDHVAEWCRVRDAIHDDVLRHGWNADRQAFTAWYADDSLDASALLIPIMGFLPIDHPQVTSTVARIRDELTVGSFVFRSRNSINGPDTECEGAFLPCSCWLAMALAMGNRLEEAQAILDEVAALGGDLGILSEQVDPTTTEVLGNLPLVFSHAEYLRACLMLQEKRGAAATAGHGRRAAH